MRAIAFVLGSLAVVGTLLIGALLWVARRPADRRDYVSDEWRDEQLRGRRE